MPCRHTANGGKGYSILKFRTKWESGVRSTATVPEKFQDAKKVVVHITQFTRIVSLKYTSIHI